MRTESSKPTNALSAYFGGGMATLTSSKSGLAYGFTAKNGRLCNAFILQTFFQPDEFYQALEPAWAFAFGVDHGAWITWEWQHHLRSSIHPAIFAAAYRLTDALGNALQLDSHLKTEFLLAAPKIVQPFLAAVTDLYTWKLGRQVYGSTAREGWIALLLTVGNPWNWFCATRTFSNCLETTLTVIALYNWPFHWGLGTDEQPFQVDKRVLRIREKADSERGSDNETIPLRWMFICAALATVLRPTNGLVWLVLLVTTFARGAWQYGMTWEVTAFVPEGIVCGSAVLFLSAVIDRTFYGVWTFPTWNFFKYNVLQSIAVFYGNNNWHYYLSQGYPLMLQLCVIPAAYGLHHALRSKGIYGDLVPQSRLVVHGLALVSLVVPAFLSVLSHKEVRFLFPILPALHVIAARPLSFIGNRRLVIACVVIFNLALAGYVSLVHNSGLIGVTDYLRHEFETHYQHQNGQNLTLGVLMPCHSIPWRSHLQYPPRVNQSGISGWALTCEPPLDMTAEDKASYLDEADVFYEDPVVWLKRNMDRNIPQSSRPPPGVHTAPHNKNQLWGSMSGDDISRSVWLNEGEGGRGFRGKRSWPDYLLFFEQLEPTMKRALGFSAYEECARLFNSHGHDDWRRKGDVIVWCLPKT